MVACTLRVVLTRCVIICRSTNVAHVELTATASLVAKALLSADALPRSVASCIVVGILSVVTLAVAVLT